MEPKEYDKLAVNLDKIIDRSSFIPSMFAGSLEQQMSAQSQRKLSQAVLCMCMSYAPRTVTYNDEEVWLRQVGSALEVHFSLDNLMARQ